MITASIIADSINPAGNRLTTFLLTYPRFIHSEFMTHRAFSRNAASSRAQPVEKMISAVRHEPARFEHWGANNPGMQSNGELDEYAKGHAKDIWEAAGNDAAAYAEAMSSIGAHKQVANRMLEPFSHITVIATASQFGLNNFFALRAHPMAQPEFQVLAYRMLAKYMTSNVKMAEWGQWHIPYYNRGEDGYDHIPTICKIAVGRIARVSYNRDEADPDKNIELHDRLAASGHWSPFEHVAQAISPDPDGCQFKTYPWSNFDNPGNGGPSYWGQYRKLFPNENQSSPDLFAIMAAKPEWINA